MCKMIKNQFPHWYDHARSDLQNFVVKNVIIAWATPNLFYRGTPVFNLLAAIT